jgi:hypothetical protein
MISLPTSGERSGDHDQGIRRGDLREVSQKYTPPGGNRRESVTFQ